MAAVKIFAENCNCSVYLLGSTRYAYVEKSREATNER